MKVSIVFDSLMKLDFTFDLETLRFQKIIPEFFTDHFGFFLEQLTPFCPLLIMIPSYAL